jgi:hypothetical protein
MIQFIKESRMTMLSRFSLGFALAFALPSAVYAQQINRGPMQIVGLRSPDGDGEAATAITNAMRDAARTAGYQVPESNPSFDQEFAVVGCTSTSPECLGLIAADIHSTKFIYGTVSRLGRGRDAQLSIEVSLWDDTTHREIHREQTTIPRSQARGDALRELATRLFFSIGNRDMSAQQSSLQQQQQEAARVREQEDAALRERQARTQLQQAQQQLRTRPTILRTHVLRYVGLGVMGLGVVAGGVGVWQMLASGDQRDEAINGNTERGLSWARYDNQINSSRALSVSDVCSRAATDASSNSDAAQANTLCAANGTSTALAYAFGIGGIVLTVAGAALVIVDTVGGRAPPADAQPAQPAQRRTQIQISPVLGRGVGGVNFGMTF